MKRSTSRLSAVIVAAAALPLVLAGCGGDSADTTASAAASAVASASAAVESSMAGGDPSTWAPVELSEMDNGTTVDLVVGQAAVFTGLPADDENNTINIESDNPDAVMAVQGDGTTTVPGFTAQAPGEATVIVWDGFPADGDAEPIMQVTVKVTEAQ